MTPGADVNGPRQESQREREEKQTVTTEPVQSELAEAPEVQWRIVQSFTHRKITYSPGEPLPSGLTAEEIDALYQRRAIAKRTAGGGYASVAPSVPSTAEEYLRASDLMVLRRIRKYRPKAKVLGEILREIEATGRGNNNLVFLEAIRFAAGVELGPDEVVL